MNRYDYLLVLSPSISISAHVLKDKRTVKRAIGNFEAMNSKAHITITNFYNRPDYEVEALIPSLRRKIVTLPPIDIKIDGYDYFENSATKTIYLKPVIGQREIDWFDQICDHVKKNSIVPHITIAKGISNEQFEILWPIFKDQRYSDSFLANYLTILKRETYGQDNYYEDFEHLKFKNHRLVTPFTYKNRRRRTGPRGPALCAQISLF